MVDTLLSDASVAREADTIIEARGVPPLMIVSNDCTEMTTLPIPRWSQDRPVEDHYIASDKPQQYGYVQSFNDGLRD